MPASASRTRRRETPKGEPADNDLGAVLQRLITSVAERPPTDLEPALDAALESFARRGMRHSSVRHIARELGLSQATVYRRVGTIEDIRRLVLAREAHRLAESLPGHGHGEAITGPHGIVATAAAIVRYTTSSDVFRKIVDDEPELWGQALASSAPTLEVIAAALEPFVAQEMASGRVRNGSPRATARLLVRVILAAVVAPPSGDIEEHLGELLLPVLEP